jgi:hypothetical protein
MELIGRLPLPKWYGRSKMKRDPQLAPSMLIGPFQRNREGLGLSEGGEVGSYC